MLLVFHHLLSQLVSLLRYRLVVFRQFLVLSLIRIPTQIQLDLVCEVLIQIFGHLELLLDYLQLIFERFV